MDPETQSLGGSTLVSLSDDKEVDEVLEWKRLLSEGYEIKVDVETRSESIWIITDAFQLYKQEKTVSAYLTKNQAGHVVDIVYSRFFPGNSFCDGGWAECIHSFISTYDPALRDVLSKHKIAARFTVRLIDFPFLPRSGPGRRRFAGEAWFRDSNMWRKDENAARETKLVSEKEPEVEEELGDNMSVASGSSDFYGGTIYGSTFGDSSATLLPQNEWDSASKGKGWY